MSSILDALKKLEEEKVSKQAAERSRHRGPHSQTDLLAPSGETPRPQEVRLKPKTLLIAAATAVVFVATLSVVVTLSLLGDASGPDARLAQRQTAPLEQLAPAPVPLQAAVVNAEAPTPAPPATAPVATPPVSAENVSVTAPAPAPVEPAPTPAPAAPSEVDSSPPAPPEPAPAPEATAEPEPEPERKAEPEPEPEPADIEPDAAPLETSPRPMANTRTMVSNVPYKPEKIDMLNLPPLRESDKPKFGLEGMVVNMLRDVTETRPLGQAIINLDSVMIGEDIPDSRARVIAIDQKLGIAIEIVDSGERYYVRK